MDTGYIKPANSGTQGTSGTRAYAGTAISLKSAQFTPSLTREISANPELSANTPAEVNLGSLQNMTFQLRCILNTSNTTDMGYVQYLLDMVRTNGYKLMWYDYTATGENNNGQLIYQIALNDQFGHQLTNGEKTLFSISDNFYHLHVVFTNFQPQHSGQKGSIVYTLTGTVLKVEASQVL